MLLALMQPNDLKKVFTKMECTEFSKFYRTSKWVYNFLEDTTEDVMIFAHRHIGIHLICSEAEFTYALDFPKCKAKFRVDTLLIICVYEGHLAENAINCAISQGIKRVGKLELQASVGNIKLSRMMLEKLQPQHVREWCSSYRELADFWNILSETSAKKGRQMVIASTDVVLELGSNFAKVQISSKEPNSEIVPWVANQIKNFHKDNLLKGLEMRVDLLGDLEIDRYFPNPTVSFLPQKSVFPVHYFVFSALKYSTFVEVRWIQSKKGSLLEVRCWNCENSEEAERFLKDSCKIKDEYFNASWKQIIDDCFN